MKTLLIGLCASAWLCLMGCNEGASNSESTSSDEQATEGGESGERVTEGTTETIVEQDGSTGEGAPAPAPAAQPE